MHTVQQSDITGAILLVHVGCEDVMRRRTDLDVPQKLEHGRADKNSLVLRVGDDDAAIIITANAGRAAELVQGCAFMTSSGQNLSKNKTLNFLCKFQPFETYFSHFAVN